jgi:hypothetical protein
MHSRISARILFSASLKLGILSIIFSKAWANRLAFERPAKKPFLFHPEVRAVLGNPL